MTISDLFSSSFLFSISIFIILIGSIFLYVNYRMSEQDHKISSMLGLISTMAEELQFFRSKLSRSVNNVSPADIAQFSPQFLGGKHEALIEVSDEEDDDDEDDEDEDDEDDEDEDDEDEDDDDDDDDEDEDEDEDEQDKSNVLDLNLEVEDLEDLEDLDNLEETEKKETKSIHINENTIDLNQLSDSNEGNMDEFLNHDNSEIKTISLSDLGDIHFDSDGNKNKLEYKKMPLNKLRDVVIEKGLAPDASKLKKQDILKLLGDE